MCLIGGHGDTLPAEILKIESAPMGRSTRQLVLALVVPAGALAFVTSAVGQSGALTISLDPNLVGRPSALVIEADGESGQSDGRVPKSVILSVQRGFKLDPRARAVRCSPRQARNFNCPEASRIGSGRAVVTASGAIIPGGSQDFTASIGLFVAPPPRTHDVAGVVVAVEEPTTGQRGTATGRIVRRGSGPYGYELRFEDLSAGQSPPPGITIKLKRLDLRAGARRNVTVGSGDRRHRVTFSLITNPLACDGTWNGHATLSFTDGSSLERDLSSTCRRR
jgi:hypothetical protein